MLNSANQLVSYCKFFPFALVVMQSSAVSYAVAEAFKDHYFHIMQVCIAARYLWTDIKISMDTVIPQYVNR